MKRYINNEEIRSKKKKFFILYGLTICLAVLACMAFIKSSSSVPVRQMAELPAAAGGNNTEAMEYLNAEWFKYMEAYETNMSAAIDDNKRADTYIYNINEAKAQFKKAANEILKNSPGDKAELNRMLVSYNRILQLPVNVAVNTPAEAPATTNTEQEDASAFRQQIVNRDKQIEDLRRQLAAANKRAASGTKAAPASSSSDEEVKFLKWALSSQSGEVKKLQDENARLKKQLRN